ncbi:MAG: hypothetical protein EA423_00500 [Phycisphaerales bacterium]|nr:MAG: hypothetical protein EA423_00500 [Phycisphaerales bacterium]
MEVSWRGILIHLHIPKNAGTTLSRMVKLRLVSRPPTRLLAHSTVLGKYDVAGLDKRIDAIASLPEREQRRVRFFEAHCAFGIHERLPGPHRYMTIIREPVDRTLSVFGFCKKKGFIDANTTLDQFLDSLPENPVWQTNDAQIRYLAGERGVIDTRPVGAVDREMLELAKKRLDEMFFVGVMERFDESVVLLGRQLGWRGLAYGRSNVNRERTKPHELDYAQRELILSHNRLDTELYEHARDLLQRRIDAQGPGFAKDVDRFLSRNRRAGVVLKPIYNSLMKARKVLSRSKS